MIQMHSPSPLLPQKITEFNYIALKQISLNLLHGLPPKKTHSKFNFFKRYSTKFQYIASKQNRILNSKPQPSSEGSTKKVQIAFCFLVDPWLQSFKLLNNFVSILPEL